MKRNEFKSYKDAKFFMENKGIKTQREYFVWQKGKSEEYKIPANPRKFYGNEWSNWGEYLNSGNIAFQNMEFYSYEECKKVISKNNIDSKRKYLKFQKTDEKMPSNPNYTYKEWISWYNFLNKDVPIFLNFNEARNYVRNLNIKSTKQWALYLKNKPSFIPAYPDNIYDEWISWNNFFGCKKIISTGEYLVEKYLIDNKYLYKPQKKFPDCRNIKELPFDFYLPDFNLIIEYDGEHHYKSIKIHGGDETLKRVIYTDSIKNKYCLENNIKLIRIPYWDLSKIDSILKNNITYAII